MIGHRPNTKELARGGGTPAHQKVSRRTVANTRLAHEQINSRRRRWQTLRLNRFAEGATMPNRKTTLVGEICLNARKAVTLRLGSGSSTAPCSRSRGQREQ
jgi:hypothetical protein